MNSHSLMGATEKQANKLGNAVISVRKEAKSSCRDGMGRKGPSTVEKDPVLWWS